MVVVRALKWSLNFGGITFEMRKITPTKKAKPAASVRKMMRMSMAFSF